MNYTDARTTAVAGDKVPAALVSNVEIINVRNVNGTAASAGTKEVATFSFADVVVPKSASATVAETVIFTIAGRTVTLTSALSGATDPAITFTAANIAAAFAGTGSAGITVGGTLTGYTAVLGAGNTVVFTAADVGNQTTNLTATVSGTSSAVDTAPERTALTPGVVVVDGTAAAPSTGANIEVTASNFAGATDFNSVNSLQKVTFTGLSATQKLGIVGNGTVANGDVDYTSAATTVINVSGGTKQGTVTNTGSNVTTATINSTGAANTLTAIDLSTGTSVTSLTVNAATNLKTAINNDFAATAALTVAGAASSVELTGGNAATLKTIDASGLTAGGLTIALSTTNTSFKGGQGNDVVTTAAIATTASVDAGAGTADVIVVGAGTDTDSAAKAAVYKNFEVLRTADDQNMANFTGSTITAVQMNAATSKTLSNVTAAQAAALTVRGDQSTAFTVTLADATGSADVVNLTMNNSTATAAAPADVDIAGFSIAGVETLNVTSSGGGVDLTSAATLNSLAFANGGANKLKAITVTGASSLDLSTTNTAVAVAIDASGLTGSAALKISGNVVKGSSVKATANKDDITVTAQADGNAGDFITYDAGAGDDAISATVGAINNSVNTKASVKIDGGAGKDTLTLTDTNLTMGDAQFQYVTNVEVLKHTAAGTDTITTGGFFDTNYKASGFEFNIGETTNGAARSVDASSFTGKLTVGVSNNDTANVSTVKTGSGDDTITLTQGTTINTTTHVVEAGQGNDTITAKNAFVTITGGKGADVIDITDAVAAQDVIVIAAGDSTTAARDKVTGFAITNTGTTDKLVLAGTAIQADVTAADGTDVGVIKSHKIASGVITFDDINAYDTALVINATNLSDVLTYLTTNITTAGNTVAFAYDSDNNGAADATIVYQAAASAADATVVELVGLTGVTAVATSAAANTILIG